MSIPKVHKATPIVYRLPKLSKIRKYRLREIKPSDWYEKNCIAVDTETTIDFPKTLRTIQLYIGKNKHFILGTDEPDIEIEAIMKDIQVYSIDEVKAFMEIAPFLGCRFVFFNAAFDIGQIGFSHFRKYFSLIDMKLWKLKVKKLGNGTTFIKAFPRRKFLPYFFEMRGRYQYNPIIKKYYKREFNDLLALIDAAYCIYGKERAYKYLKKKLYVKDFVLDISAISSVLFYRMSLKSLCEVLGIRIGKKDYNRDLLLKEQLHNVLHHAEITQECCKRLLKILFYDMAIKPNPCYIAIS